MCSGRVTGYPVGMGSLKTRLAGKAAKKTAKHTAKGTASKLRRDPLRSTTLLALGCAAGFIAGRKSGPRPGHAS
jgi:hypothetical protein